MQFFAPWSRGFVPKLWPCAQVVALWPSKEIEPKLFIRLSQSPCTKSRRLTSQLAICLTKSLNSTRPTEGHLRAYWGPFWTRVIIFYRKYSILMFKIQAVECIILTIWQVSNLLEQVSDCNSFDDSVDNKNWQIWKTQLWCFHTRLYFVGLRISSGRFLKVRQKRPRTNKYLRKRIHSLKLIFDFHSTASHNAFIAPRVEQEREELRGKKQIFTWTVQICATSLVPSCFCFFAFFSQVETENSASLWAFLSFADKSIY